MTLEDHPQEHSEGNRTEKPTNEHGAEAETPVPIAPAGLQPPPAPPGHDIRREESDEEKRRKNVTLGIEIVGLGVLIIYTTFAGFQWVELNTANINQSAAIMSSGASADRALKYTRDQIKAAQDQMRLDERAWVGLRQPATYAPAGTAIRLRATVQNVGKTPAHTTNIKTNAVFLDGFRTELPANPPPGNELKGKMVVFPGDTSIAIDISAPDYAVQD